MKAFQVTDFDSNPTIEDIPKPTPTPNQIRIKIMACGLNFADLLMQNGSYQDTPELPFVLGMEVSGIVDEVGSKVKNFSIGERVAVFGGHGGLAEYGCFDALKCFQIPVPCTTQSDHMRMWRQLIWPIVPFACMSTRDLRARYEVNLRDQM